MGAHRSHGKSHQGLAAVLLAALAGGCSHVPNSINPVVWWHDLEGGVIAQQRPPAPGLDDPYPNLASVPAKPPPPDLGAQHRISDALVADRANAQYAASLAPIAPPPAHGGTAPLFAGPAPQKPADADAASASMAAASAPPMRPLGPPQAPLPQTNPSAAPARRAPTVPVQASALPSPPPPEPPKIDEAALPPIPDAPPTAPVIAGVTLPKGPPTPPPTAPAKPTTLPPVTGSAAAAVPIPFAPASAIVSLDSAGALRALAGRRNGHPIEVIGYGEAAPGAAPAVQAASLDLAFSRAKAMAAVLTAAGVPQTAVHLDAEPDGRGAAARLVD